MNSVILEKEPVVLKDHFKRIIEKTYSKEVYLNTMVENITYLSDNLKVKGYIASPKKTGRYPILIWNRGGWKTQGALDDLLAYLILASTAEWGYVVLATQYRGNLGGDGNEDWGDKDINDSLNLLKVAEQLTNTDMSQVAIEGASRGGMTTYRALSMDNRFKCAIVHAGLSDVFALEESKSDFKEFIDNMFGHLTLDEWQQELSKRSVVYFADKLPKTCPILIMHGDNDKQVPLSQSESLVKELRQLNMPHHFEIIKNGGHVALKDGSYKIIDEIRKKWLKKYLD